MYIETPFRQIIIVFVKEDISKKSKKISENSRNKRLPLICPVGFLVLLKDPFGHFLRRTKTTFILFLLKINYFY